MHQWLSDNDIVMYSAQNEFKSFVAERFMRTQKSIIYKKMTANNKKNILVI